MDTCLSSISRQNPPILHIYSYTLMETDAFYLQAKASNETQQRANDSKSDGMQRSGADALGGVINKVYTCCSSLRELSKAIGASTSELEAPCSALACILTELPSVHLQGANVVKKQTGTAFNDAAGLQKNVDFPVKLQDKVCSTPRLVNVLLLWWHGSWQCRQQLK
jgi:hypothetical protein